VEALNKLNQEIPVIFPIHPKTKSILEKNKIPLEICACEPFGYFDMLHVLQKASLVITDSGGLSRESFFFKKNTLVLMQNPFWPELFIHGNCLPCLASTHEILCQFKALSESNKPFNVDIFGNGHAAENISRILLSISYQD
jgi:UDP-GlcNAc3NAcA epimerase